jgi:hypothetical protein
VARISVDPDEMTALASACQLDTSEIMSMSATVGTHVAGAGLNLLLAYGIGITSVVDRLAHIAGAPDGVLRVAHRFDDNARRVVRTRDGFLRADGQTVPTSAGRWSPWDLLEPVDDLTDFLKDLNTYKRTLIAGKHELGARFGLFLTFTSGIARTFFGDAGKLVGALEKEAKTVGDAFARNVDKDLETAERRFAQEGEDLLSRGRGLIREAGQAKDAVVSEIESMVKEGERSIEEGARFSRDAKLLGELKVFDKFLGPIGDLIDLGFLAKDVLNPDGGKIDPWDVALDSAQVVVDVATVVAVVVGVTVAGVPAVIIGGAAAAVIGAAQIYKDNKKWIDHEVATVVTNKVQGTVDVVTGSAGAVHGVYDVVTGNPAQGGKEIVSGGVKAAKGVLKSLDPF